MSELGQKNISHEGNVPTQGVVAELYGDEGYTVEGMNARSRTWVETGFCPGPEVAGRIIIDDESLQYLFQNLPINYHTQDGSGELISEDDRTADRYARRDEIRTIDPRARELLRDLFNEFNYLIQQDTERSDNPAAEDNPASYISSFIKFGAFTQIKEEIHIDESYSESKGLDAVDVRYVVTIAGPNTVVYKGEGMGPELFNRRGDFTGDELPATITRGFTNTGEVNRFVRRGDPHALPVSAREPRIFMSGTVRIKAHEDA